MLIIVFSYWTIAYFTENPWGQYGGLVDAGDYVFSLTVLLVNMKILLASYQIGWGILVVVFGSIAVYFLCFAIVSETQLFVLDDNFGSLYHLLTFPVTYLGLIFFLSVFALLEYALEKTYKLIKYRKIAR